MSETEKTQFRRPLVMERSEDIFECAPFFFSMDRINEEVARGLTPRTEVPMKKHEYDVCSIEVAGVTLTWRDLSVFVHVKSDSYLTSLISRKPKVSAMGHHRRILNNVSGVARPGTLLAIMGASGSGKTTLLNTLALRLSKEAITDGQVAVNGHVLGRKHLHHMAGFVHQNDYFYETLTVREHLVFTAKLRLDSRFTKDQITQRVEDIMKQTGLRKCEHSRIGKPGSGLSGGERKRLAFASEILADPPLIFCDEPTSGLDFYTAQAVIGVLENMAAKGKTVLCSIHQPSSDVFSMFTELLLLAEGRVAFMGPVGDAHDFFDSLGYVCPPMFNPSDYYVQKLAVVNGKEESSLATIKSICEKYAASIYSSHVEEHIERTTVKWKDAGQGLESYLVYDIEKYQTPWMSQFQLLLWRGMVHSWRHNTATLARASQKLIVAIYLSLMYTNITFGEARAMDITGVIFLFLTENAYPTMISVLRVFPDELPIFQHEYMNGLYRAETFYAAKAITIMPAFIIESVLFVLVTYWIIGLNNSLYSILLTILIVLLLTNTASACGCLFSAFAKDSPTALAIVQPFDYIMLVTGGLFIHVKTLPTFIAWVQYLSWFRYSNEALNIAQWHDITNLTCADNFSTPCFQTGDEILHSFGFDSGNLIICLAGLIAIYFAFHILGCLALIRRAKSS